MGKLAQAVIHASIIVQVNGTDDCLTLARELSLNYPLHSLTQLIHFGLKDKDGPLKS